MISLFKFRLFELFFVLAYRVIKFTILLPFTISAWLAEKLAFIQPVPLQLILQVICIGFVEGIVLSPVYGTLLYKVMIIATIFYGIYKNADFTGDSNLPNLGFKASNSGTHGSQRWAAERDLRTANLLSPKPALILGKYKKQLVGPPPDAEWHSILIGGSGTGKTTCGIIPTILNFPGSAVILDIKGEISRATWQERSQLGPIIEIAPAKEDTYRYDPIAACDDTPEGIVECAELARALIPDPPQGGGNEKWVVDGARGLVSALAYITGVQRQSLTDLAQLVTVQGRHVAKILKQLDNKVVLSYAQTFLTNESDKTGGYYISKANDYLLPFSLDESIQRLTTPVLGKTFDFGMLNDPEKPCTVYLQVPEEKVKQYSDLWRLFFVQLLQHLQRRGEGAQPHILVAIDEFPQLGKMDQLPEMFATLRSRNVHVLLAGQSIADVDDKYGPVVRRRIIDSCNYVSIFGATDPESQKYLSEMLGKQTIITRSGGTSDSSQKLSMTGGSKGQNDNWQETGRELLRPEELRDLGDHVIVVSRQTYPAKLTKTPFFKKG